MPLVFTWDEDKAASNLRKHGIAFEDAVTIFGDPLLLTIPDRRHSGTEERFFSVGLTLRGGLLAVAHTEAGDRIRIISARKATAREKRIYAAGENL